MASGLLRVSGFSTQSSFPNLLSWSAWPEPAREREGSVTKPRLVRFLKERGGELALLGNEIAVLLEQLPNIRIRT